MSTTKLFRAATSRAQVPSYNDSRPPVEMVRQVEDIINPVV